MIDMLRRILMSLDTVEGKNLRARDGPRWLSPSFDEMYKRGVRFHHDLPDDPELVVDVSPLLRGIQDSFSAAYAKTPADFTFQLQDGDILETNSTFACMLFAPVQGKVSATCFSSEQRSFYNLDGVSLSDLTSLIELMCGRMPKIKLSAMLHLLSICREYLVPELVLNELVACTLRRVLHDLDYMKDQGLELERRMRIDQVTHFMQYKAKKTPPVHFGYSARTLSTAEIDAVQIGEYYCYVRDSIVSDNNFSASWFAALVVSEKKGRYAFIRYDNIVKEVDLGSLHLILNFDNVEPKTAIPITRLNGSECVDASSIVASVTTFGSNAGDYEDKIGHFCVLRSMKRPEEKNSMTTPELFLGVFDDHTIFVLRNGCVRKRYVGCLGMYRCLLVHSLREDGEAAHHMRQTRLIVGVSSLEHRTKSASTVIKEGEYCHCITDEYEALRSTPAFSRRLVLHLGACDDGSVEVMGYDDCRIYKVRADTLRKLD
jgi:hypothetical protein